MPWQGCLSGASLSEVLAATPGRGCVVVTFTQHTPVGTGTGVHRTLVR